MWRRLFMTTYWMSAVGRMISFAYGDGATNVFTLLTVDEKYRTFHFVADDNESSTTRETNLLAATATFCRKLGVVDSGECRDMLFDELKDQLNAPSPAPFFSLGQCESDERAEEIQRAALDPDHGAICTGLGVCRCTNENEVFDGRRCSSRINETAWFRGAASFWYHAPGANEAYVGEGVYRPKTSGTVSTTRLLSELSDIELLQFWESAASSDTFTAFHSAIFSRGSSVVLDIGSGIARQTLQFAENGARVVFADVVPSNLEIIRKVAAAKGLSNEQVALVHFTSIEALENGLDRALRQFGVEQFDAVTAFGSLHHAPRKLIQQEMNVIIPRLRIGGIWLQLAYSITRWTRGGAPPFNQGYWGGDNDLEGNFAPWAEWYAPGKLLRTLRQAGGAFVMSWCGLVNDGEFIWMSLVKTTDRELSGACERPLS